MRRVRSVEGKWRLHWLFERDCREYKGRDKPVVDYPWWMKE